MGWARALIGGLCLALLCGASGRLAAQTGGQQGTEVAAAKADALALPDAPFPAAAAQQGESFSAQQFVPGLCAEPAAVHGAIAQRPWTDAGRYRRQRRAAGADGPANAHAEDASAAGADYGDSGCGCVHQLGRRAAGEGNYSDTTSRDIHIALGATAVAMYAATASYAIRAPRVSHEPARGGVKWHKYLIYIHAPGMVLTPILGAMAYNQIASGQKVHGIASAHGGVAAATAASYGAAIIAVSWPIHLKF